MTDGERDIPIDPDWLASRGWPIGEWTEDGDWEAALPLKLYEGDTCRIVLKIREHETLIVYPGDYWPCKTIETRGDYLDLLKVLEFQEPAHG